MHSRNFVPACEPANQELPNKASNLKSKNKKETASALGKGQRSRFTTDYLFFFFAIYFRLCIFHESYIKAFAFHTRYFSKFFRKFQQELQTYL